MNVDSEKVSTEPSPDIGSSRKRARWSHEIKLFLVGLLKDYDVSCYRTQNTWSKEAWTNIVSRLNVKFGTSYSLSQVKQKEKDLKKDYRIVKELKEESGFRWDSERNMVTTSPSVWDDFAARKNNTNYLCWSLCRRENSPWYEPLSKKNQRMLLVLQLNKQMRPMHISHHLLPELLSLNRVYNFILMTKVWIHRLLFSTCKSLSGHH